MFLWAVYMHIIMLPSRFLKGPRCQAEVARRGLGAVGDVAVWVDEMEKKATRGKQGGRWQVEA